MAVSLRNQVALITGASVGIGRATALALAQEGCRLILTARTPDRLQQTVDDARKAGASDVLPLAFDVRARNEVDAAIDGLPADFADVRILVNNAGLARGLEKLWKDAPEDWEEMIDTNTRGLLYMTRAVVPGMVARNVGHVISLGSTAGWMAYAGGSVYCATKAAERSIMEGLRIDLMGTAVRVTSIDPGMVQTDFSEVRFRGDKERAARVYQNITPLQPEDVADAIRYAVTRPAHVNVSSLLLTSIDQANSVTFNRHSV